MQQQQHTLAFKTIDDADELTEAFKDTTTPLLVQFSAVWCRRCGTLKEEIVEGFTSDEFRWVVVDVDDHDEIRERFQVTTMPRLDLHIGGKRIELSGFDATVQRLKSALETEKAGQVSRTLVLTDDF